MTDAVALAVTAFLFGAILGAFAFGLWMINEWYRRALRKIRDDHEAACRKISDDCKREIARISEEC